MASLVSFRNTGNRQAISSTVNVTCHHKALPSTRMTSTFPSWTGFLVWKAECRICSPSSSSPIDQPMPLHWPSSSSQIEWYPVPSLLPYRFVLKVKCGKRYKNALKMIEDFTKSSKTSKTRNGTWKTHVLNIGGSFFNDVFHQGFWEALPMFSFSICLRRDSCDLTAF